MDFGLYCRDIADLLEANFGRFIPLYVFYSVVNLNNR
jgi:hypothetical protein